MSNLKKRYLAPKMVITFVKMEEGIAVGSLGSRTIDTEMDDKVEIVNWESNDLNKDVWF